MYQRAPNPNHSALPAPKFKPKTIISKQTYLCPFPLARGMSWRPLSKETKMGEWKVVLFVNIHGFLIIHSTKLKTKKLSWTIKLWWKWRASEWQRLWSEKLITGCSKDNDLADDSSSKDLVIDRTQSYRIWSVYAAQQVLISSGQGDMKCNAPPIYTGRTVPQVKVKLNFIFKIMDSNLRREEWRWRVKIWSICLEKSTSELNTQL